MECLVARVSLKAAPERSAEILTKTADAASGKLWSGYALPTFPECAAKWPTFAPPNGLVLLRR